MARLPGKSAVISKVVHQPLNFLTDVFIAVFSSSAQPVQLQALASPAALPQFIYVPTPSACGPEQRAVQCLHDSPFFHHKVSQVATAFEDGGVKVLPRVEVHEDVFSVVWDDLLQLFQWLCPFIRRLRGLPEML